MDAHDFLITLFDHLDTALLREHFVGSMNCISRCTNVNCNFESIKQEPFTALTLRIPSTSPCDLNDCLQMFNEEEILDINSQCSCCGLHTVSERKLCVTNWSNVLVIHLSRFSRIQEDRKDAQSEHTRLDTPISFPLIGFNVGSDMHPIVYDCVAVCNHFGSCTGGHYTAHALRGEKWFCLDDAQTPVEINKPQINIGESNSSAYMLFYERRPFLSSIRSSSSVGVASN
jgi:ubiquitin C-terminal hydrolase